MRFTADKIIQLTFYAVIAYLVLIHYKGANALAGTFFGGYAGAVTALQGRNPGRAPQRPRGRR